LNNLKSLPSFGIILRDFQDTGKSDSIEWLPGRNVSSGSLLTVDQTLSAEDFNDKEIMDGIYF
jgi:hypothetical protein